MKIKRENLAKSRIKLTIEVEADKTNKFFEEAYKKLAPTVEIKGFRPGQAPRIMTLEAIGHGRYHQTTLDIALPLTYYEAIQGEKMVPVQQPAVAVKEFSEGKPLIYEAEVDIVPEIKLGDYKKVKVKYKKPVLDAKEEELKTVLDKLQFQAAVFNDTARPAQKGDRVEINFEGLVDGVRQDNLASRNHPIILGQGSLVPGFEKNLEGMKKSEEKEFTQEIINTKDKNKKVMAKFKVKMLDVKETILPEIDAEFAKKFGHDSADKLKEAIKKSIILEKEQREKQKLEKEILEKIVAKTKFELPESLIEQEITRRLQDMQTQMGPGFYKYLDSIGKKIEEVRKEMRPSAEESVRTGLVLGEIAKAEGLLKHMHDAKEQQEVIRKTIDLLVKMATSQN